MLGLIIISIISIILIIIISVWIVFQLRLYDDTTNYKANVIKKFDEYNPSLHWYKNMLYITTRVSSISQKTFINAFYSVFQLFIMRSGIVEQIILYQGRILPSSTAQIGSRNPDRCVLNAREPIVIPSDMSKRYEDARIFYYRDNQYILVTMAEVKRLLLIINGQEVIPFNYPGQFKNWNFFVDAADELLLLTDMYPFRIQRTDFKGNLEIVVETKYPQLKGLRCTSTAVKFEQDSLLTIAHDKENLRIHSYFVVYKNTYPYNLLAVSNRICFFGAVIEFASGLTVINDRFYIGVGVNDAYGYILETTLPDIKQTLDYL